ncbi:hypothetical protein BDV12DRAFT_192220 [Aspergillus spectabilis]
MAERGRMQLRATVRLPQRLEQDSLYMPPSRLSLRGEKKTNTQTPRYIDYNPNLPPAAFPTLDRPRGPVSETQDGDNAAEETGGNKDMRRKAKRRNTRASLDNLSMLTKSTPDQKEVFGTSSLEDIPVDELDNYMASNGEHNPVWASNMTRMASAGQDSMLEGMEDSDLDETMEGASESSSATPPDPTWTDLSPQLQVEIFLNLLQNHSYPTACRMLDLTAEEHKAVQELLIRRYKQADAEDLQLQSMRAKQMRELLKIDNSSRTQNIPHQLVFRKVTRQTFRKLTEAIDTDIDFFCCESSELNTARTFLRKLRIEPKFAGSWGNNTVLVQDPKDNNEEEEEEAEAAAAVSETVGAAGCLRLDRIIDTSLTSKAHTATTATTSTVPEPETSNRAIQEAFINWIGDVPTGTKQDYLQRNGDGDPTASPRWLTLLFKECIEPEKKRIAKRRREDIELVQDQDRWCTIPPALLSRRSTSLEYHRAEIRALRAQQIHHPHSVAQRRSSILGHGMASLPSNKEKKIFKKSLRDSTAETCSLFEEPSSELPLPLLPNEHRTVEPKERQHSQPQTQDASLPGLVKTSAFIRLSLSPRPQNTNNEPFSSDPETDLFEFEDLVSPQTAMTTPSLTGISPGEMVHIEIEGLDTVCEGALLLGSAEVEPTSQRAHDGDHAGNGKEGEGDCEGEEGEVMHPDEMVLLPTGSEHH